MSETYIFGNVGQTNAQIGTNTMLNTTGAGNTAFGNNVFTYLTSGINNSGFGVEVASGLSFNGSNNTAYGVEVMKDATTASDTSGFGYQALTALTSGNNNTGFGLSAGLSATTAANNTIVGANATTISPSTTNALVVGFDAVGADKSIVVGSNAKCLATAVNSNNIVIGDKAHMGDGSSNSILIGPAGNDGGAGAYGNITDTVAIGAGVLSSATALVCDNNLIVGAQAGSEIENLSNSVYMGSADGAGYGLQGERNLAIGYQALADPGISYDNIGFGYNVGKFAYGNDNVLAGYACGEEIRGGVGCTGIGGYCMYQVSSFTSASVSLGSILKAALTGTGGFADPISSLGTFVYKMQTVIPGTTTGVAPGTAVNINGLYAVFETQAGAVGAVSKFSISTSTSATTAFLSGKYFFISSSTTDYYVWYNIDNLTPDPAVVGRTGIEVNLTSGESPNNINFYTYNAIRNFGGFETIFIQQPFNPSSAFLLVNTGVGNVTDIAPGTAVGFGKITTLFKIRDGTGSEGELNFIDPDIADLSTMAGTYFLISSATTDYYVWFNDGFQTDPMIVGRTGIQISYVQGNYNTASGWSAMRADTTGGGATPKYITESTALGYRAMEELNTGSHYNTIIGAQSVTTNTTYTEVTTLGANSDVSIDQATSVGASSSSLGTAIGYDASSTSSNSLALGTAASAAANQWQIGENAVSGAATMNFRTQLVADEAWIGGGSTSVTIDNNGNIVRGTDSLLTFMTTDSTPTTMETYTMADNTTREVEALVMGTRTGGVVGSTAQTYSVRLDASIKRTGVLVTVNKVTEVHLQDMVLLGNIVNQVAGYAVNISGGTAVTAGGLSLVTTSTDGKQASLTETMYIDFYSISSAINLYTTYILFSSPTTDYYIWFDLFGFSPDPMIPGRTGLMVSLTFSQLYAKLMQDVRDVIHNVGGAGTTFNAQFLSSTVVEITYKLSNVNTANIDPGTAGAGTAGSLSAVYTTRPGGSTFERSIIDTYGATPAGLDGKWFLLYGSFSYYVWYRVDGVTTDPGPGGLNNPYLVGKTGIVIDIVTGDSDLVIATKSRTALDATSDFNTTGSAIIITNNVTGTPIAPLSFSTSSSNYFGPVGRTRYLETYITGSPGVAQVVDMSFAGQTTLTMRPTNFFNPCAWFKISTTTTSYYFWYSSPGYTVNPGAGGVSVPIMLTATENEVTIAQKTIAAVNSTGVFTATGMPEHVTVHNVASGPALNSPGGTSISPGFLLYGINTVRNGTTAAVAEISLFDATGATPATLGGKYFVISSTTTNYYIWYNTDGGSVDPGLGGTGVMVAIVTGDTEVDIINKSVLAISAIGGGTVFTATAAPQWVIDIVASGTDAILQVTGSDAINVTWKAYTRNFAV